MNRLNTICAFLVLGVATVMGNAVSAATTDLYKGTFQAVNALPYAVDWITIIFDGAGNFTGTDVNNNSQDTTTSTYSISGTYSVSANGTMTLTCTNCSSGSYPATITTLTATLSADGNSIVATNTHVSTGSIGSFVAIRQAAAASALINTGLGYSTLNSNTTGANNTAFGGYTLYSNTTGKGNAAQGVNALYGNTTGIRNLGIGSNALYGDTTGSYNVALGFDAGYNQSTGDDDIYISNVGVAAESQTLRLGTQGTAGMVGSGILNTYIAGVATSQVTGSAVYVNASGQLGVLASSERFKTNIMSMGNTTDKLTELRPVSFHLKADPQGAVQYGLIAEEVEKIYPELVIRDTSGTIQGVRYDELAPLLLNEVQQQRQALAAEIEQRRTMQQQLTELMRLNEVMRAELTSLKSVTPVAMR